MNKDFFRKLERAVALASQHEKELLAYPGVIAVGAGPARRAGKLTGDAAIVVTVRRKRALGELQSGGEKRLPARLGDVRVDVVEEGQPLEAPEIVAAQAKATSVLTRVKDGWLSAPNVTAIGIGYKSVNGETDFNRIALKFFVAKKLAPTELRQQKLRAIPPNIDGVLTDVDEMAPLRPAASGSGSRDDRKDPIVGGLTVGVNTKPFWFGTLGAFVFDRASGEQMVLSNQHVLDGPAGTEVVQPSPIGLDDSLEIGFQLDVCNPIHFFRLDTPNTTVGTVLAGAAVAAAVAAALSDEIDPTRRGQAATMPPPGARTLLEAHKVKLGYPELPIPGTHFEVDAAWEYTRRTDAGDLSFRVDERKQNPHALADKLLLTDKKRYRPGETIHLFGLILPEECARGHTHGERPLGERDVRAMAQRPTTATTSLLAMASDRRAYGSTDKPQRIVITDPNYCPCDRYYCTAILTPTKVDRAFPIVLREPTWKQRPTVFAQLLDLLRERDDKDLLGRASEMARHGCLYIGELTIGDIPTGPWMHYLYVQTVNYTPGSMNPLEAARIIGGLPVGQNSKPVLDVACGPFVWEDGQFDIEVI